MIRPWMKEETIRRPCREKRIIMDHMLYIFHNLSERGKEEELKSTNLSGGSKFKGNDYPLKFPFELSQ